MNLSQLRAQDLAYIDRRMQAQALQLRRAKEPQPYNKYGFAVCWDTRRSRSYPTTAQAIRCADRMRARGHYVTVVRTYP